MLRATEQQLQHLCVIQTLHSFPIDMRYEISWPQSSLKGRTALVYSHHQMVHRIEIRVSIIDTNRVHGEAKATGAPANYYWGLEVRDERRQLTTW